MRIRAAALAAWSGCALVALAPGANARELFRRGELLLEYSGSLREIVSTAAQTDADRFQREFLAEGAGCLARQDVAGCPPFDEVGEDRVVQNFTRLRNRLDLRLNDIFSAVVVYDNEIEAGEIDTLEGGLSRGFEEDTFLGAEHDILDRKSVRWRHILYRGYLKAEAGGLDASVGRQRVAWGVGRLWQPIDRFSAVPPLAIQADQSPGIDSIDLRWSFDGFHFLQAVYAPGTSRDEAREALRFHGVFLDTDYSVMAGRFERAVTVGFDIARNLGPAAFGFEAVYTDPEREIWPVGAPHSREPGEFWQVVVSLDGNLAWGPGIYWLVEHLYNGNALGFGEGKAGGLLPLLRETPETRLMPDGGVTAETSAVFGSSRVVTAARHQTGIELGGDITPEVRFDLLTILDWNGGSAVFFPSLHYTPLDFLELTAGVQVSAGPRLSQYGDAGELAYLLIDLHF